MEKKKINWFALIFELIKVTIAFLAGQQLH